MSKQSQEQLDVKEQAQSNRTCGQPLIEIQAIEGTPFKYIHNNETDKGFIALGNYRISEEFNNQEEAELELPNVNNWDMLLKIIIAITELKNENNG